MRFHKHSVGPILGAVIAASWACAAAAADLQVISTMNIRPSLDALQGPFEQKTGNKINFTTQGAAATQKLVEGGAQGDVVIGSRGMLDLLLATGKVKPGSIVDIAHSSVGVVVRVGAEKPDISTDEKFKQLLLKTPSIAYPDPAHGSLGGNYFSGLIQQWGLADTVNAKAQLTGGGPYAAEKVAEGKAQIAVNQIAEFKSVQGVTFLKPLPPSLTDSIVMSVALLANARESGAAASWIAFLKSPAAGPAIKANGMEQ